MGITFNGTTSQFQFDFAHDTAADIISLTGRGYQVEAFGRCFYYGYEFADDVAGSLRSAFIRHLKFEGDLQADPDLAGFIRKAVDGLSRQIDLYDYDMVVMPQSSSKVNQYMLRYIYRFAQPQLHRMELVKALPESISFDMDAYEKQYLDDTLDSGRPRYTQAQKDEAKRAIAEMLELIHRKDYFTIAKDVRKSRLRPYITHFLHFATKADEELCRTIQSQNVLVIDDIATSGATLGEILRTLRIINETNNIAIFSLIGRQDLMAER